MYVFVYGTLKKDEPNFHWLTNEEHGKSEFYSKGRTVVEYPLVIASRYNIPFLLDKAGTGKRIQGEIYKIDEKMLSNLDILEEYPKLYTRRLESIQCVDKDIPNSANTDDVVIVEAWTYFLPGFRSELLDLPFIDDYKSTGDKPYVARYIRDSKTDHRPEVKIISAAVLSN